jgi:hypothetical protein
MPRKWPSGAHGKNLFAGPYLSLPFFFLFFPVQSAPAVSWQLLVLAEIN